MRLDPVRLAVAPLLRCQTDERLLELARAGHEPAFEAIVERYRRPLLRYCGRLLPPCRAEDAVQQTFLGAYRAIHNGPGELRLRPWLYRAAHNASVDALRENGWDNEPIDDESSNCVEQAEEAWEGREDLRDLLASLRALPPLQRDAIVLRELEGRGHQEIASRLGLSEGAARQLIHRARAALRTGASALTPWGILDQLLAVLRVDPVPARIPELVAGGGGAGMLVKVGAAGVVAGAIAVSGAHAPVPNGERAKHRLAAPQAAAALHAPASVGVESMPERLPDGRNSSYVPRSEPARDNGAGEPRSHDEGAGNQAERERQEDNPSSQRKLDGDRGEAIVVIGGPDDGDEFVGDRGRDRQGAEDLNDEEHEVAFEDHDDESDDDEHDGVEPGGDEHEFDDLEDED